MKIHFFNPGHETAVLNKSPYYMAPANVAVMQRELAYLSAWYADKDGAVFVWDRENESYFRYISENLKNLCTSVTFSDLSNLSGELCFWGISPQVIHFWEVQNKEQSINLNIPSWKEEYFELNSRQMARKCLQFTQSKLKEIESNIVPQFCNSLDEIEELVRKSSFQLLAKAPYSSSGRGLQWLPIGELTRTERQILHGILKKQGSVSIEKALNKRVDFAMEFMSDGVGNIHFAGYSLFKTNVKGAYSANILDRQENIENKLTQYVDKSLLNDICTVLSKFLTDEYAQLYKGCIGVDMMIYLDDIEAYRIHPCVEINMRYNMGYLSLMFTQKYLSKETKGEFRVDFSPIDGDIYEKHQQMQKQYPVQFKDNKLFKGYLPLCPVKEGNHYWAYVMIE